MLSLYVKEHTGTCIYNWNVFLYFTHKTQKMSDNNTRRKSKDFFEITLDCRKFKENEIRVTNLDQTILIERKREGLDEASYASRHAVRKYPVPDKFDANSVKTNLTEDGMLHVYVDMKKEASQQ